MHLRVKLLLSSAVLLLWVASLAAQEETAEADPIVVTGTLELRQSPPPADSFMRFFEKQVAAKKAEQDALASPFWNARFWSLIPIRLESSMDAMDPSRFSIPNYATIEYREAARYMNELNKHSIFDQ